MRFHKPSAACSTVHQLQRPPCCASCAMQRRRPLAGCEPRNVFWTTRREALACRIWKFGCANSKINVVHEASSATPGARKTDLGDRNRGKTKEPLVRGGKIGCGSTKTGWK